MPDLLHVLAKGLREHNPSVIQIHYHQFMGTLTTFVSEACLHYFLRLNAIGTDVEVEYGVESVVETGVDEVVSFVENCVFAFEKEGF